MVRVCVSVSICPFIQGSVIHFLHAWGLVDLDQGDMSAMSLGLSHSLSRYKLKFSPDKVDTMIIQAICE